MPPKKGYFHIIARTPAAVKAAPRRRGPVTGICSIHRSQIKPAVTCAALSLKLYLKCLLVLEGKDREDKIYRIAELFRNLSGGKKKVILEKFEEFSNTELSSDELMRHLDLLDNAFERWRYIHEEGARSVNLEDVEEMILAAKATIVASKPDWGE